MDVYTVLHITQINVKDPLDSTGSSIHYLVIMYQGEEFEKIHAPQCSLWHHLQLPRHGSNLDAEVLFHPGAPSAQRPHRADEQQVTAPKGKGASQGHGAKTSGRVSIYVNCHSATKKSGIMPFAATWLDLEMIILSKMSQTEKDKYYIISLLCGI